METLFELIDFGCRALDQANLTLTAGQCLGLTGPSGTGKSLFLRALADLDPYEGQMRLDGIDAARIPAPQWRRQVGLLPAESAWWFDAVGDHFDPWPPPGLDRLGLDLRAMTWQVSHLSSGERQRLGLLRLLVQQPRVMLLDEPTANLDPQNVARVEAVLTNVLRERRPVMVWVSHDLEQLRRRCDPILLLKDRRLVPLETAALDPGSPSEDFAS